MCSSDLACGWWAGNDRVAIVQHRPAEIHLDERRGLHNPAGPAIRYRGHDDGLVDVYAIDDVVVPRRYFEAEPTAAQIMAEPNAEVRRVLMLRFGWGRFVGELGLGPVHEDEFGALYRSDDLGVTVVRVLDAVPEAETGKPREFFLRVDPSAYGGRAGREARAAVASTFFLRNASGGLDRAFATPEDYRPAVQT